MRARNPHLCIFTPPRCRVRERGEGRVKPPQFLNKMFLRRRFDVCALSKTKLKEKGEVVGRVSGVAGGRAREGVALLLSGWLMRCVVECRAVSSMLMWVRVKIERERERERELGVYIGIWTW